MPELQLPKRGESIIFITPPTVVVDARIYLYGHDLYTVNLHTRRLVQWLESRGVHVDYINSHADEGSRAIPLGKRPAGPLTSKPVDLACYAYGLDESALRRRLIDAERPSQVWITSLFAYDRDLLRDTIGVVRSTLPGVPVVVGGTYASLCPDDCKRMGADVVHRGVLPEDEEMIGVRSGHCAFVVAGRGCPNRCAYCAFRKIESAVPKSYSEQKVLGEIDRMVEDGASLFALYAPAVFRGALAETTERMYAGIAERDLTTLAWAGFEPQGITPRRAELLRRAGAIDSGIPLQVLDRDIAKKWGRRETLQEYLDSLQMMRDAGFSGPELSSDFICGHPDLTLEDAVRAACFIWSQGVTPIQFPYTCVPGSTDAAAFGVDFSTVPSETLQPYLWPFARAENTAYDYIQFSILSRVLPQCVTAALASLDPDSVVLKLVERYLNEYGFSIPQWEIKTPLPQLRTGYLEHFCHPWELVLTLQRQGGVPEAARFVDVCENALACEPTYLEIPLTFFEAGLHDAAIRTLPGAARCLPRASRRALDDVLRKSSTPEMHFREARAIVANGLRRIDRAADADRWKPRIAPV